MLATIMQAIDTTIANVALPYMQGKPVGDAGPGQLGADLLHRRGGDHDAAHRLARRAFWAQAAVPDHRSRASRRRRCCAGWRRASAQIVLFRLLQGICGAALVPLSQAVLLDTWPHEKHGSAMALWGVGVMVGPILGPTLGGWLTESYSWRWVFYVNLPVGILTFIGLTTFLHESGRRSVPFDWFGFATLSLAIGALQLLLDRGEQLIWFGSTEIIAEAIVSGTRLLPLLGAYLHGRPSVREPAPVH